MDVAIRELKAKLSSYLRRAASGEVITVTLGPALAAVDLRDAAEAGWVTPATTTGLRRIQRQRAIGSVQQALDEDRAE